MQEDKIGNSRMVQNGKKTRLATLFRTAVCPEGPADFCDSGSPFSEKRCQICYKGCQILTSRNSLGAATGSSRQLAEVGQQVWPGTYLPHAPEVRMT